MNETLFQRRSFNYLDMSNQKWLKDIESFNENFVPAGSNRAYFLVGPPGSGKSTCLHLLKKKLKSEKPSRRVIGPLDLEIITNDSTFEYLHHLCFALCPISERQNITDPFGSYKINERHKIIEDNAQPLLDKLKSTSEIDLFILIDNIHCTKLNHNEATTNTVFSKIDDFIRKCAEVDHIFFVCTTRSKGSFCFDKIRSSNLPRFVETFECEKGLTRAISTEIKNKSKLNSAEEHIIDKFSGGNPLIIDFILQKNLHKKWNNLDARAQKEEITSMIDLLLGPTINRLTQQDRQALYLFAEQKGMNKYFLDYADLREKLVSEGVLLVNKKFESDKDPYQLIMPLAKLLTLEKDLSNIPVGVYL